MPVSTQPQMRASEIARRRTEDERGKLFFLRKRRRRRRIHSAMRERLGMGVITTRRQLQTPRCAIRAQETQWMAPNRRGNEPWSTRRYIPGDEERGRREREA
jgi:hypothetical protein